jgi:hypothetical protein
MRPEDILQEKLCQVLDLLHLLYFSIPNGADKTPAAAEVFRRTGLKPGVPDLCVPVPVYINDQLLYHGTYIEVKRPGKYPPPEQREWHRVLRENGYRVEIIRSAQELIELLCILYPKWAARITYFTQYAQTSRFKLIA